MSEEMVAIVYDLDWMGHAHIQAVGGGTVRMQRRGDQIELVTDCRTQPSLTLTPDNADCLALSLLAAAQAARRHGEKGMETTAQ